MAKTNIWIALYPKDWLGDTQDLTTQQHGAYFLLSMTYVIHGAPPRDNDDELARITKLTRRAWLRERERISRFFDIRGGFWFHKRIERELSVARPQQREQAVGQTGGHKARITKGDKRCYGITAAYAKRMPFTFTFTFRDSLSCAGCRATTQLSEIRGRSCEPCHALRCPARVHKDRLEQSHEPRGV
jgi:uncharacterized protein YdaU (DUF1376 family)